MARLGRWSRALIAVAMVTSVSCGGGTPASVASASPSGGTSASASASASADPMAALIAAAKAEGSLMVYGSPNDAALAADTKAFQAKYGIDSKYIRLTAAPLTTRVDQEVKASSVQADIVITADAAAATTWSKSGTFAALNSPAALKFTDQAAAIQQLGQGLYYDSARVASADVPKTFADLLNPRWKGRIVMGSPRGSPSYAELYLGILKDPKYGEKWFTSLADQKPRIVETDPQVPQTIASGEADLGLVGLPQNVTSIKQTNPASTLAFTYLDIITVSKSYVGVLAKAPHPNAGQLFAAWLMTPEGQAVHNGDNRSASPLGPMPSTLPMPEANRLSPLTSIDVTNVYQSIIDMFDRLYK